MDTAAPAGPLPTFNSSQLTTAVIVFILSTTPSPTIFFPYSHLPPSLFLSASYEDFSTIDWVRDYTLEVRRKRSENKNWPFYKKFWHSTSGWVLMAAIGCAVGFCAGFIDIAAEWLNDLKEGVCPDAFWLNRKQCCWAEAESVSAGRSTFERSCDLWLQWSSLDNAGGYMLRYIVYIVMGVVMAVFSAVLVKRLAPYAAGSGIPEVKTILSGFVIHGYFDLWTLSVKASGMALAVGAGLALGKEVSKMSKMRKMRKNYSFRSVAELKPVGCRLLLPPGS